MPLASLLPRRRRDAWRWAIAGAVLLLFIIVQHRRSMFPDVPIFIVEEHQNVLPLWYEMAAVDKHMSNALLIHIDAHSDTACPSQYTTPERAIGKRPHTRETHFTSNDEFIEDAIHAGLVGRLLWIVPDWGMSNEYYTFEGLWKDRHVVPSECRLHVGSTFEDGDPCDCIDVAAELAEPEQMDKEEVQPRSCSSAWDDEIDQDMCNLESSVDYEVVAGSRVSSHILHQLQHAKKHNTPVILDIDEDFFSTYSAVTRLSRSGWTNDTLAMVDVALGAFCVANEQEESVLSAALQYVIQGGDAAEVASHPYLSNDMLCRTAPHHPTTLFDAVAALRAAVDVALESATLQSNVEPRPSPTHMRQMLIEVGVSATPRSERSTAEREFPAQMAITTGVDQSRPQSPEDFRLYKPNEFVTFHTPSPQQLAQAAIEFERILEVIARAVNGQIKVITVARSVRDGYTPARLQPDIEEIVLRSIRNTLGKHHLVTVLARQRTLWPPYS